MARATRSRDGRRRFTLRAEHRIGRRMLARIIARQAYFDGEDFPSWEARPDRGAWPTSREGALSRARRFLQDVGERGLEVVGEDLPGHAKDAWIERGRAVVDDLFPELKEGE